MDMHDARRKSIAKTFAELTALLEDMHGLAVEGQNAEHPFEFYQVLAQSLESGLGHFAARHAQIVERVSEQ